MFKKIALPVALFLAVLMSMPVAARSAWDHAGRITARTLTSLTIFDTEPVSVAIDEHTVITPWIREKPFVRKPAYLTQGALKFGGLVRLRMREGSRVAEEIQVATDVKAAFTGRVLPSAAGTVAVYQGDMGLVTLKLSDDTELTQWFTVKPFVRKPVRLNPGDLQVGSLVQIHTTKKDPLAAGFVEIATTEPMQAPAAPLTVSKSGEVHFKVAVQAGDVVLQPGMYRLQHESDAAQHYVTFKRVSMPAGYRHGGTSVAKEAAARIPCDVEPAPASKSTAVALRTGSNGQEELAEVRIAGEPFKHIFPARAR